MLVGSLAFVISAFGGFLTLKGLYFQFQDKQYALRDAGALSSSSTSSGRPTDTTKYHKGEGLPCPIISKPHSFRNADRLIDGMEKWMVLAFPSIGN